MLYQFYYQLPQRQATQLLYSRFVNVSGLPGHNIPTDLHLEHLNAIVKSCVKSLRANKTEEAIKRSAKALGNFSQFVKDLMRKIMWQSHQELTAGHQSGKTWI